MEIAIVLDLMSKFYLKLMKLRLPTVAATDMTAEVFALMEDVLIETYVDRSVYPLIPSILLT